MGGSGLIGFLQTKGLEAKATQDYESSSGELRGPPRRDMPKDTPRRWPVFWPGDYWLPFITDNKVSTVRLLLVGLTGARETAMRFEV